jgi:hypothetical protein
MSIIPYTSGFVALHLLQAVTVLMPRDPPRLVQRPYLGLIPLAAIGGVALLIVEVPAAAEVATDIAAIGTPVAALAGLAAFRVRLVALLAPVLYLVAWRASGRPAEIAGDLLIVAAAAALAWLTGMVAPRGWLAVGIGAATIVDVYQVVVTDQIAVASQALSLAAPVSGLPRLQELVFGSASMGWGDAYIAGLLGVVLAAEPLRLRLAAAATVALVSLPFGLLFHWLDVLPATVPVAVALCVTLRFRHGNDRYTPRRAASDRRRVG